MTGSQIKELRLKLLYTQSEFAKIIGVSITTIQFWEYDKKKPSMRNLRKINDLINQERIK